LRSTFAREIVIEPNPATPFGPKRIPLATGCALTWYPWPGMSEVDATGAFA